MIFNFLGGKLHQLVGKIGEPLSPFHFPKLPSSSKFSSFFLKNPKQTLS